MTPTEGFASGRPHPPVKIPSLCGEPPVASNGRCPHPFLCPMAPAPPHPGAPLRAPFARVAPSCPSPVPLIRPKPIHWAQGGTQPPARRVLHPPFFPFLGARVPRLSAPAAVSNTRPGINHSDAHRGRCLPPPRGPPQWPPLFLPSGPACGCRRPWATRRPCGPPRPAGQSVVVDVCLPPPSSPVPSNDSGGMGGTAGTCATLCSRVPPPDRRPSIAFVGPSFCRSPVL